MRRVFFITMIIGGLTLGQVFAQQDYSKPIDKTIAGSVKGMENPFLQGIMKSENAIEAGVFEPYDLSNRIAVTSAMIANPSKLRSIDIVAAYPLASISDIRYDSRDKSEIQVLTRLINGEIVIATISPNGETKRVDEAKNAELNAALKGFWKQAQDCSVLEKTNCIDIQGGLGNVWQKLDIDSSTSIVLSRYEDPTLGKNSFKVINWGKPAN